MNVIVTGASRGIGEAVVLAFAREGHRVLVGCESRKDRAEGVLRRLREAGGEGELFQGDVADPARARALVARAEELWGPVDGLVNNAGVTRDRTILKMSEEEWRRVIDVNLSGAFWCLQAAAASMAKRKAGFIVNVASIVGVRGGAGCANYAASKAGLLALTKSAARELGRFNVRVNAVLPGFHRTEMGEPTWKVLGEKIQAEHVLPNLPDLGELAKFVVFLSGQKSVSGQVYNFESRVL